jgi:hypothetical protein
LIGLLWDQGNDLSEGLLQTRSHLIGIDGGLALLHLIHVLFCKHGAKQFHLLELPADPPAEITRMHETKRGNRCHANNFGTMPLDRGQSFRHQHSRRKRFGREAFIAQQLREQESGDFVDLVARRDAYNAGLLASFCNLEFASVLFSCVLPSVISSARSVISSTRIRVFWKMNCWRTSSSVP